MSSNAITIPGVQIEEKPWVDTLHEWVTTVDHKRLGHSLHSLRPAISGRRRWSKRSSFASS